MAEDTGTQAQQLSFFPITEHPTGQATPVSKYQLATHSSLDQAIGAFQKYMQERGFTINTQQAFHQDIQLLGEYLGPGTELGEIGTATLNAFLRWMDTARGVPCSPKTMERRITTLKVFFGWLTEEQALPRDIAAPLIHHTVSAPLPEVLSGDQLAALLRVTEVLRKGTDVTEPDARPHLLVTLILNTGIKKSECANIHLNHLDLVNAEHPALWIRYRNNRRRHKERRIPLPAFWPHLLNEYLVQYPTHQRLFPWTPRNLEYVLTGVAEAAGVARVTFETLRWTCAVRDYQEGMEPDALRRKLGLSEISWYEVHSRLELLSRHFA